jgi:hypothetical protein
VDVMNSATFTIPATRTYSRRECQWFGRDANGYAGVIIRLWDGKHRSRGSNAGRMGYESDLYAVTEEAPPVGVMARAFTFLNLADDNQELPYRVLIGQNHSCTCDAGRAKVPGEKHSTDGCKHRDAVRAAIESGFWDGLDDDEPAERYQDESGEMTAHELATA